MEFNIKSIQDGLMAFRNITRELLHKNNNMILRDKYGSEAYYFKMENLEFITYGASVKEKMLSNSLNDNFEKKYDNEFALQLKSYKRIVNEKYNYRILTVNDSKLLTEFKLQFSKDELESGAVSIEDPFAIGAFDGAKLIGVSSTWEWENNLVDIGLIIATDYRGQGIGTSVVSVLIDNVINNKICVYRADYENVGSIKIAEKLGFERITKIHRLKK